MVWCGVHQGTGKEDVAYAFQVGGSAIHELKGAASVWAWHGRCQGMQGQRKSAAPGFLPFLQPHATRQCRRGTAWLPSGAPIA